ncbi:MAG: methyltransferase domain-containing protein [Bryobacteraceae bacterium]|nr:methyltransferase domain-containing protein [Bryobacteraceae bacterium]
MDYFREYLENGPLFAALLRGAECQLMERARPFDLPVLDLGCGDGFFGSLLRGTESWVGLDPDEASLRRAGPAGRLARLVRGDGSRMGFASGAFGTVISNSVLEHVVPLHQTLAESFRVLRPGGRLLLTAPSHRFADLLLGAALARSIGLKRLARAYGRWFNNHSRHHHTVEIETWRQWLEHAGFRVVKAHYYLSPAALRAFDAAHYLSVPRLVSRKLTGRWMRFPNPLSNALYDWWLRRYCDPSPVEDGPYLFIEARKP